MSISKRYKYCTDNDIIYELGEHDVYYPIIYVVSAEQDCSTSMESRAKLDYMKEYNLGLYVDLAENDELADYINNYLREIKEQKELIFSQMDIQDEMGRLLAEELARDNLL